jgi:hypothetical protein
VPGENNGDYASEKKFARSRESGIASDGRWDGLRRSRCCWAEARTWPRAQQDVCRQRAKRKCRITSLPMALCELICAWALLCASKTYGSQLSVLQYTPFLRKDHAPLILSIFNSISRRTECTTYMHSVTCCLKAGRLVRPSRGNGSAKRVTAARSRSVTSQRLARTGHVTGCYTM